MKITKKQLLKLIKEELDQPQGQDDQAPKKLLGDVAMLGKAVARINSLQKMGPAIDLMIEAIVSFVEKEPSLKTRTTTKLMDAKKQIASSK